MVVLTDTPAEAKELQDKLVPLHIKGSGYEEYIAALTDIGYAACEYGARQMQEAGRSPDDG